MGDSPGKSFEIVPDKRSRWFSRPAFAWGVASVFAVTTVGASIGLVSFRNEAEADQVRAAQAERRRSILQVGAGMKIETCRVALDEATKTYNLLNDAYNASTERAFALLDALLARTRGDFASTTTFLRTSGRLQGEAQARLRLAERQGQIWTEAEGHCYAKDPVVEAAS